MWYFIGFVCGVLAVPVTYLWLEHRWNKRRRHRYLMEDWDDIVDLRKED